MHSEEIADIPAYVICLNSKRKERCDKNFPLIKNIFPKAEWVNAVDGTTLDYLNDRRFSILSKYNVKNNLKMGYSFMNHKNQLACALSHISVWEKIKKSGVPGIVFEDDIVLDSDKKIRYIYSQIPKNVDFAAILYTDNANTEKYNDNWYQIKDKSFYGLMTYFITPNGARHLLENAYPINVHIDQGIGYLANINPKFKAICYKNKYSPSIAELFFNSTLNHQLNIKSELPENNSFYVIILIAVIVIVIVIILWIIYINRNRKTCNIKLKKCKLKKCK